MNGLIKYLSLTVREDSEDGKVTWISNFVSRLKTRTFSVGFERRSHLGVLFNVDSVWGVGNVGSSKGNTNNEISRFLWVVFARIGSVSVIDTFRWYNITMWIFDSYHKWVSTR